MAANANVVCNVFKRDILTKKHDLDNDIIKLSLHAPDSSLGKDTTAWTASGMGEISSSGYTSGGVTLPNGTASVSNDVAIWTPASSPSWMGLTATLDAALLYNSSSLNRAIAVITFGQQQLTAGNFGLNMPVNASGTALIRVS